MKYIDYMNDHEDENLSWCKPYADESGEYTLILHDGMVDAITTPDRIAYRYNGTLTEELMESFARAVNPDYDDYSGWDDLHIALESMHEVGCAHCPFKDDCEAMGEEMSDTDCR